MKFFKEGDELKTSFKEEKDDILLVEATLTRKGKELLQGSFRFSEMDHPEVLSLGYGRMLYRMQNELKDKETT